MAIPQNIEELAHKVRTEIYGRDVREALATSMEATAEIAEWSRQVAQQIIDGSFDEGAINTEIERKLNELESQYAPDLNGLKTEVGDARGSEANLSGRLNSIDADLAQNEKLVTNLKASSGQRDFLQMAKNYTVLKHKKPRYKINGDRNISFFSPTTDNEEIQYKFIKDNNDDFIKMSDFSIYEQQIEYEKYDANNADGFINTNHAINHYSMTSGRKITHTFNGTGIWLNHFFNNDGAVWRATVDGNHVKDISTHSDGVTNADLLSDGDYTFASQLIVDGLDYGEHTLVLEHIADDPANPGRAWILNESDIYKTFTVIIGDGLQLKKVLAHASSNKEFAFNVSDGTNSNWFPEHNAVGTVFLGDMGYQRILVDGVNIIGRTTSDYTEFDVAEIIQVLECRLQNDNNSRAILTMIETIKDGVVSMMGKMEFLQSSTINIGYTNMLPSVFGDLLTTSQGYSQPTSTDGSDIYFEEGLASDDYVFTNGTDKDYFIGVRIEDKGSTLRDNREFFLQNRSNLQKMYPKVFENDVMSAGDSYTFSGTFYIGKMALAREFIV